MFGPAVITYPLLFSIVIVILVRRRKKPTLPYPPGPKSYPILGNSLDLPLSVPIWETFVSLANDHGTDILYLRLMGEDIVILNSNEAISDLVEKRSNIYSDRPQSVMTRLTRTGEWVLPLMPYGDEWRARRRLFHEVLGVRLTSSFDNHRYKYTYHFLSGLLEAPERFFQEVEFTTGAIILSVTYGIDLKSADDPYLIAVFEAVRTLGDALIPGRFLVDAIPIFRYLPDWFPGGEFKAIAKQVREKFQISTDGPMEYVKSVMKSGERFSHSMSSDCLARLEGGEKTSFSEQILREVSGTMFAAAAVTTTTTLQAFFLAMTLNPDVMKKAQGELDRVVGKKHLPDYSDKENLPYIDALVKELLRWSPPLPVSIPKRTTQDDVYRGYFIPAGATVIENVWAIFRDPDIYPDPEAFNPDRFLKDGEINPLVFNPEDRVFGSGRRICPGKQFALRTVYLLVASVLSAFDIGPALDEEGNPQMPKAEFYNLLVRDPKPFKCTIKPRSEGAVKLVKEACDRMSY